MGTISATHSGSPGRPKCPNSLASREKDIGPLTVLSENSLSDLVSLGLVRIETDGPRLPFRLGRRAHVELDTGTGPHV